MKKEIVINLPSRLHITLIAMNSNGYRINGGLGFAINDPNLELYINSSKKFDLIDERNFHPLVEREVTKIKNIVNSVIKKYNFKYNININISGKTPTHFGFGTGTSIRLAILESLFKINNKSYDEKLLIDISGRGRTSGIGIRTYFEGGFIMDLGHQNLDAKIQSSSEREHLDNKSLQLVKGKMPIWEIGICIPKHICAKTHEEEKEFFEKTVPIRDESIYETLYHSLFGVISSFLENNKEVFNKSITRIQETEWKKKERMSYNELQKIEKDLFLFGAKSIGMSSLGPTLFFMSDSIENTVSKMRQLHKDKIEIFIVKPNNKGREMKCLN